MMKFSKPAMNMYVMACSRAKVKRKLLYQQLRKEIANSNA